MSSTAFRRLAFFGAALLAAVIIYPLMMGHRNAVVIWIGAFGLAIMIGSATLPRREK